MNYNIAAYLTPEQVSERLQLAIETVYRWLRSGKLRGSRLSQKAWRVSEEDLRSLMNRQNVSELLFEDYLANYKLGTADREPAVAGRSRRVDYRLNFARRDLWFEVKEFREDSTLLGESGRSYDPYVDIRKKIDKATEKFREYEGECCSLVLYNREINLADVCTPSIVLGAMLGNISIAVPMSPESEFEDGPGRQVFGKGGKLKPSLRTRISAVIALEKLAVGKREFYVALARKEREENRRLPWEEFYEFLQSKNDTYEQTALRVLVYENPYAKQRLPANIFVGPFDERWGLFSGQPYIGRISVGPELTKLETAERELGLDIGPIQKRMQQS